MRLRRFVDNYIQRHLHPLNQLLHLVGVPLVFVGSPYCLLYGWWMAAVFCFFTGYLLQFLGHRIEQNDPGEVILFKKMMHQPFIEFGPLRKE
ncbi:MAG: Mpo1-like protein [Planctomycetaceae bacterium]